MADNCPGSQGFPSNYDGESTVCDACGRKLHLARNGRLPSHNTTAKKVRVRLMPRGEARIL